MGDSQWPRYEVFKQDKPGQPHRNVGSVHAPDIEMALLNARDVFARRPAANNLWVVAAAAIVARTAGELEAFGAKSTGDEAGNNESYAVFVKRSQRPGMTYVEYLGLITAPGPEDALCRGAAEYGEATDSDWWVCPQNMILASEAADVEPFFEPAQRKLFRMPNQYRTVSTMQKIKRNEGQAGQ